MEGSPTFQPSDLGAGPLKPDLSFLRQISIHGRPGDRDYLAVTSAVPGSGHIRREGVCGPDVTLDDLRARFHDRYFGGRDEWISGETYVVDNVPMHLWRCIEHTD